MNYYSTPLDDVLNETVTDAKVGLTHDEAKLRLEKNGENRLKEKKKKSLASRFFDQFKDVMIIILLVLL